MFFTACVCVEFLLRDMFYWRVSNLKSLPPSLFPSPLHHHSNRTNQPHWICQMRPTWKTKKIPPCLLPPSDSHLFLVLSSSFLPSCDFILSLPPLSLSLLYHSPFVASVPAWLSLLLSDSLSSLSPFLLVCFTSLSMHFSSFLFYCIKHVSLFLAAHSMQFLSALPRPSFASLD